MYKITHSKILYHPNWRIRSTGPILMGRKRTSTIIEWTYIDTNKANITKATLEAAELSIPKSSGKTSTPYWKNNVGIKMAKHSYNTKLKAYRRHISPTNLEQVQTEYKEYTKLCTHVRNLSWNQ